MRNQNNTRSISYHAQKRRKRRRQRRVLTIGISVFAGVLLIGGIFGGMGAFAVSGKKIYPNLTVDGVSVGNLTIDQAAQKLDREVEKHLSDKFVEVVLGDGVVIKITGEQAGLTAVAETAASQAYDYGRNGNILMNTLTYLRCQFGDMKMDSVTLLEADEEMVRSALENNRQKLNEDVTAAPPYEIRQDSVTINKGKQRVAFDEQKLAKEICRAFENGQETLTYGAEMIEPEQVDLDEIYDQITVIPVNAEYDKENRSIKSHTDGFGLDREEAQRILDAAEYGTAVEIPLAAIEPEITADNLEKQIFPDVLASSTTDLGDEPNEMIDDSLRTMNVELAANAINGTILEPGDRFEFNKTVGKRTAERGYQLSDAYAGTEIVTQLGGGICQVSSTMYHALLHTDIQMEKRRNHTLTVAYLPLGMDAAVSWGNPDFVFTNNTGHPVKIEMVREGDMLTARFHGTKTGDIEIEPRSVTISSTPFKTVYKDDPTLPKNKTEVDREGGDGYVVDVYKDYKDAEGNVTKSVYVGRDTYKPTTSVVRRGTGTTS